MYAHESEILNLAGLGAVQTGTVPQGTSVMVPAGTVVSIFDPRSRSLPTQRILAEPKSLLLAGPAAVQGDVVGRDLVSPGGEVSLVYNTGMIDPEMIPIEGSAGANQIVDVPAGTKVVIQKLPEELPLIVSCPPGQVVGTDLTCIAAGTAGVGQASRARMIWRNVAIGSAFGAATIGVVLVAKGRPGAAVGVGVTGLVMTGLALSFRSMVR